jgi:pyruvate dehydrogenase E2 component (dihydrolipoamide acetyltransferase)
MSVTIVLPKLGNTVESSIIAGWLKQPGDAVAEGDPICAVETDKTTMEVTSTAAGVLLKQLVNVGDDVPVLAPLAIVGQPGEAVSDVPVVPVVPVVSPRARKLAQERGVDVAALQGSGPSGRIIERDVRAVLPLPQGEGRGEGVRMTPVAKAMVESGGYAAPERGSGPGGRITRQDLVAVEHRPQAQPIYSSVQPDEYEIVHITNVRRVIAERMRASLHNTAQLTMNASADARALLGYRKRLKASDESLGLRGVTINDLVLLAVAKTLPHFPQLNATYAEPTPDPSRPGRGAELRQYKRVHLGFAVDTPRGLLVPVIRNAESLTLRHIADASSRLAKQCQEGTIAPDALSGGTFTVTNLGSFGIESFTPILNAPQVAILGVGNVNLKPIEVEGEVEFIPHIGLSLTIDHQIVDGTPGAKFLQALVRNLTQIELLLAL